MTPTRDQFAGCLVGKALGDALGFLVEGEPPRVCATFINSVVEGGDLSRARKGPFLFGQYSDDTQLARELLTSWVVCEGFDGADFGARVAAIFAEGRIVGRGRATEEAAMRIARGVPWDQAGTPAPSAGNGSAMRAAPVGLMRWDDLDALARDAHDQGRATHADPRCSAGAAAIAGAVALAMTEDAVEPGAFLKTLAELAGSLDEDVADAVARLEEWLELPPDKAVEFIARAGLPPDHRDMWLGISPFVVGSVLWSLYAFLRTPDRYLETVRVAIAVGGDVDTTAAMAGAISGARNGRAALADGPVSRLNDQGTWDADALAALAGRAWDLAVGGK